VQTVVQAISEPRRREILELVRDRELAAGEIAERFDVTRDGLAELRAFLDGFWDDRLDRLKTEAETEQRRGRRGRAARRN
jgi:hypothetical protein